MEAQQKTRSSSENRVAETLVENAQHLGPLIPEVVVKTRSGRSPGSRLFVGCLGTCLPRSIIEWHGASSASDRPPTVAGTAPELFDLGLTISVGSRAFLQSEMANPKSNWPDSLLSRRAGTRGVWKERGDNVHRFRCRIREFPSNRP